eukprot:symbB.v1.2.028076.t1/scaffold2936.1/size66856/5
MASGIPWGQFSCLHSLHSRDRHHPRRLLRQEYWLLCVEYGVRQTGVPAGTDQSRRRRCRSTVFPRHAAELQVLWSGCRWNLR